MISVYNIFTLEPGKHGFVARSTIGPMTRPIGWENLNFKKSCISLSLFQLSYYLLPGWARPEACVQLSSRTSAYLVIPFWLLFNTGALFWSLIKVLTQSRSSIFHTDKTECMKHLVSGGLPGLTVKSKWLVVLKRTTVSTQDTVVSHSLIMRLTRIWHGYPIWKEHKRANTAIVVI